MTSGYLKDIWERQFGAGFSGQQCDGFAASAGIRMGSCCACLLSYSKMGSEAELPGMGANIILAPATEGVKIDGKELRISGQGIAVGSEVLEQDASYWEVVVKDVSESSVIGCGVSRPPPRDGGLTEEFATGIMTWGFKSSSAGLMLKPDDVIGVAFSQSDHPMLKFYLNGVTIHGTEVDRVRGDVCPAVYVSGGASVQVLFAESKFLQTPPSSKYSQILVSYSVI